MENLYIPKTKYTLEVNFDVKKRIFEMNGASYPENAIEFFQPIFDYIQSYITKIRKPISLNLKINYLNTSSTKCLIDILEMLEQHNNEFGNVTINWYYDKDDEDIQEMGEDLLEDFDLPINLISY